MSKYGSGLGEWLNIMPIRPITVNTPCWRDETTVLDTLDVYVTVSKDDLKKLSQHLNREITVDPTPDGNNVFIKIKEGILEIVFSEGSL